MKFLRPSARKSVNFSSSTLVNLGAAVWCAPRGRSGGGLRRTAPGGRTTAVTSAARWCSPGVWIRSGGRCSTDVLLLGRRPPAPLFPTTPLCSRPFSWLSRNNEYPRSHANGGPLCVSHSGTIGAQWQPQHTVPFFLRWRNPQRSPYAKVCLNKLSFHV